MSERFIKRDLGDPFDKDLAEFIINNIFGGTDRLNAIKNMLSKLSVGNILTIASRGYRKYIIICLELVGINAIIFSNIHQSGEDKTKLINSYIEQSNVFYIDDDQSEHIKFLNIKGFIRNTSESPYENYIINNKNYIFYNGLVQNTGNGISIDLANNIIGKFDIKPIIVSSVSVPISVTKIISIISTINNRCNRQKY